MSTDRERSQDFRKSKDGFIMHQQLVAQYTNTESTTGIDETEQEAIELIKSQVVQIKSLKDELRHRDETIENLKI